MKYFSGLIVFLLLPCFVFAQSPTNPRVRAALALASIQKPTQAKATTPHYACVPGCDCPCGENCTCTAGECGCACGVSVKRSPGVVEWAIYRVQYEKAIKENKPLLIWVGETCPLCENNWPEFIHARLSEYTDGSKGPCVIVGKPDGMGGLNRVATINGIPTLPEVNAAVATHTATAQVVQRFVPMPPPMPMMMPMMGGFGGGRGGGG